MLALMGAKMVAAHKENFMIDFTEGSLKKKMIMFAAPLFLSNLLQAVYNIVDMIIVGQVIGPVGISAISVGGDVSNFITFIAMGFSNAGQILIAQHVGAKKRQDISKIIGNLFSLLFMIAICLSLLSFFFRKQMLDIMNTPVEVWSDAYVYFTVSIIGLIFIYGYNAVSAVLRGMGDSKHPFMFIATAAIINILLDVLFITKMGLGVFGAALATVIGQGISFVWGFCFLLIKSEELGLNLTLDVFKPRVAIIGKILKLGIPMAIKSASIQISKLFVNSSINAYGVIASSASGIESKVGMIMNLVANAINVSCSTMIGQNIGAKKYDRVPTIMKNSFCIVFAFALTFALLIIFAPDIMFGFFSSDQSVIEACKEMTTVFILLFLGSTVRSPSNGLIDGTGNYKLNFVVAIFDGFINRICFALLFGTVLKMGWIGYLYGDAVAGFTPFLIAAIYYYSGKWK